MIEEMQAQKARNDANNANMVKNLAEVASKTQDPTAKAIGTGIKVADNLTGGKASQLLGKALTKNNKISPGGRMLQKASNKLGESGMGDRLSSAMGSKNNPTSKAALLKQMASKKGASNNMNPGSDSAPTNQKEVEEQTSDGGASNLDFSYKVIKVGLIASVPIIVLVVFCCLIVSASQIFLNAIGLDVADSTSSEEWEEKINNLKDEDASQSITDQNVNKPVGYDIYISDEKSELLKESKLKKYIQVKRVEYIERKYREVDLDNLHDFYPPLKNLDNTYDETLATDFIYKMYNLNLTYINDYDVNLDIPLLMAILSKQSNDMNEVFAANLSEEDRVETITDEIKQFFLKNYDYYKDWSDYKISRNNSAHDMEVLAQRMVVVDESKSSCQTKDGKCYKLVDSETYKEFLKEFLEKKYFLSSNNEIESGNVGNNNSTGSWRTWTQCGQSWSNIVIGDEPHETLCDRGCLVTSISIQIARSGTTVVSETFDPGVATKYFTFDSNGSLSNWNSIKKVSPYFERKSRLEVLGWSKQSLVEKILSFDSNKYYFILNVGPKSKNYSNHFVAVDYADLSTGNIYIIDPASTKRKMVYDHYKVYRLYILEKKD